MELLVLALCALAAVVCLGIAAHIIERWPVIGWTIVIFVALTATDALKQPLLTVSGISVYLEDLLSAALLAAAALQCKRLWQNLGPIQLPSLLLCALLLLSTLRGLGGFGTLAVVEARPFIYVIAGIAWVVSLDWRDPRTKDVALNAVVIGALVVSALAVLNIALRGIGTSSSFYVDETGTYRSLRAVISGQAMFMTAGAIAALALWHERRQNRFIFASIWLTVVVLVAQHRSVWAALAAGLVATYLVGHATERLRGAAVAGFLAILACAVLASGALNDTVSSLGDSFAAISSENSTLYDRTEGWGKLLSGLLASSSPSPAIGLPMGFGYERIGPNGMLQIYQPHNWYIQTTLRAGLLGGITLLAIVVSTIVALWRRKESAAVGIFAAVSVFFLAYGIEPYLAPLVGIGLALAWAPRTSRPKTSSASHRKTRRRKRSPESGIRSSIWQPSEVENLRLEPGWELHPYSGDDHWEPPARVNDERVEHPAQVDDEHWRSPTRAESDAWMPPEEHDEYWTVPARVEERAQGSHADD